ncbi:hypothetical protein [Adhaeribacter radiodurans]|uniref:Uncharacterized protein n=1 Tax=Adhaeribacter radiodurans TaxID=2745197 RepID=A0A7L7L602_9BACT|nr:hypothetical protein [Adhaeribacter radiodurans]QMU28256.1 hypothetical protein HUW48_09515 [Adhaeribacter radiodurans]
METFQVTIQRSYLTLTVTSLPHGRRASFDSFALAIFPFLDCVREMLRTGSLAGAP